MAQNFAQPAENLTAPSGDGAKRSDSEWGDLYRVEKHGHAEGQDSAIGHFGRAKELGDWPAAELNSPRVRARLSLQGALQNLL